MSLVLTTRECKEHSSATVTWDYTHQGNCPCCEVIEELQGDLDACVYNETGYEDLIAELKDEIENLKDEIENLKEKLLDTEYELANATE
jgi:predicted  nucleic acid-binding Zn-ribbon protein